MNTPPGWKTLLLVCALHLPASAASPSTGGWPQWRGPARDGHASSEPRALSSLPAEPQILWKLTIGGGHSGPILAGNHLVYLDENGSREVAHLVEASTGRELWQKPYADRFQDEWGAGPRATPQVDGDRLYVQSCNGVMACLALTNGRTLWQTSFETDFGVKFLGGKANEGTATRRGNNGSGVIDGDRLVLPVGGNQGSSLVCFNKHNGRVLWRSGNDEAAYSSLMVGTLAGTRQVVAFTAEALLGAELETGKILWRVPLRTNAKRHAASPVVFDDRVVVNSHTLGLLCFKITRDGGGFRANLAWANLELKINLATPVLHEGYLYSQGANRDYVCASASNGELKWSQPGFGAGKKDYASTIAVGNNLLALAEDGNLRLMAASPDKYHELGRLQVCGNTWSHPAYGAGRLYVRDGRTLRAIDLLHKQQ